MRLASHYKGLHSRISGKSSQSTLGKFCITYSGYGMYDTKMFVSPTQNQLMSCAPKFVPVGLLVSPTQVMSDTQKVAIVSTTQSDSQNFVSPVQTQVMPDAPTFVPPVQVGSHSYRDVHSNTMKVEMDQTSQVPQNVTKLEIKGSYLHSTGPP